MQGRPYQTLIMRASCACSVTCVEVASFNASNIRTAECSTTLSQLNYSAHYTLNTGGFIRERLPNRWLPMPPLCPSHRPRPLCSTIALQPIDTPPPNNNNNMYDMVGNTVGRGGGGYNPYQDRYVSTSGGSYSKWRGRPDGSGRPPQQGGWGGGHGAYTQHISATLPTPTHHPFKVLHIPHPQNWEGGPTYGLKPILKW